VLALGSLTLVAAAAADTAPVNTAMPTITGTAQQGHTLTERQLVGNQPDRVQLPVEAL
jgi:hypothetical protein